MSRASRQFTNLVLWSGLKVVRCCRMGILNYGTDQQNVLLLSVMFLASWCKFLQISCICRVSFVDINKKNLFIKFIFTYNCRLVLQMLFLIRWESLIIHNEYSITFCSPELQALWGILIIINLLKRVSNSIQSLVTSVSKI